MDDGFNPLHEDIDIELFKKCLNEQHPSIRYTIERARRVNEKGREVQKLNFLDITVILHSEANEIETEIFFKDTNSHDYLDYNSHHAQHVKDNIPYNLAKRIIVFTSNSEKVEKHLNNLRNWLKNCHYPPSIINKGIHNAKLQGPAPEPRNKNDVIPFITTNYSNYNVYPIKKQIDSYLLIIKDTQLKEKFANASTVLGLKQPKSLKRLLVHSKFTHKEETLQKGIKRCYNKNCKICKLYLQECESFKTSNGTIWNVRSQISCNSKNVIYFLSCNMCKGNETYTGKTNDLRLRTNNHISSCRSGTGSDRFDQHVYLCGIKNKCLQEPFFKLYVFMKLNDEAKLLNYESLLHRKRLDTMNY